jgi:hypothetical protein
LDRRHVSRKLPSVAVLGHKNHAVAAAGIGAGIGASIQWFRLGVVAFLAGIHKAVAQVGSTQVVRQGAPGWNC